ncbi:DUF3040 domain-containing protein [Streptomyces sp. AJS327]|uniref:DUF3040 domain-containing protein n=1 Tax=Streptomyces sp. AJS327 TaxID=2545265 RepID=UPI0015DEE4C2|nr:DUF3040 domain-containing protein [Streptomyces sp. AJS327]MBA0049713.1 DUF3040 domain-containing protein [Streptomyces sp. AJS327]
MARRDEEPLEALAEELRRSDPEFTRAMRSGRPRRPREYRNNPGWLTLAFGVLAFLSGALLGDGLLLTGGLVAVGAAAHLLDPSRIRTRYRDRQDRA